MKQIGNLFVEINKKKMNKHIKKIESKYGIEILELENLDTSKNSYCTDSNNNVIKICLKKIKLKKNLEDLLPFSRYLKELRLKVCDISSTKNFQKLPNLEVLELVGNSNKEVVGLDKLPKLRKLRVWENILSVNDLENSKLIELDIHSNSLCVKNICSIPSLKVLHISQCQLSNLKDLADKFPLLEELEARHNFDFSNLNDIEELVNLKKLDLSYCHIENIQGLESLTDITELFLHYNIIKEIKGLDKLVNLEELGLRGNYLSKISGLENLRKLRKLDLSNNDMTSYNYEFPKNLKILDLRFNEINTINEKLLNQESILLAHNRISDISETYLKQIKSKCVIDLRLNPLKSLPKNIPKNVTLIVEGKDTNYFYNPRYHRDDHPRMYTPSFERWLKTLDPIVFTANPYTLPNINSSSG